MPSDFFLSADFGFGCDGGNKSPHLCFIIRDANGQALSYIYNETMPGLRTAAEPRRGSRDWPRITSRFAEELPSRAPTIGGQSNRSRQSLDLPDNAAARPALVARGAAEAFQFSLHGSARVWPRA